MTESPLSTPLANQSAQADADGSAIASLLQSKHMRRRLRFFYDQLAKVLIALGGISVIVAILLIFIYLLYEVLPLFRSAEVQELEKFDLPQAENVDLLHLAVDEQSQIGIRLGADANAVFFDLQNGNVLATQAIKIPDGDAVTSFALNSEESGTFALGLRSGSVIVARYGFSTSYSAASTRIITPTIDYPFGESPLTLFAGQAASRIAIRVRSGVLLLAANNDEGETRLLRISQRSNLFSAFNLAGSSSAIETEEAQLSIRILNIDQLLIDVDQRWLFFISDNGRVSMVDFRPAFTAQATVISEEFSLLGSGRKPTQITFLLGGISMLVADDGGTVTQWFLSNSDGRVTLQPVRSFSDSDAPIVAISPEQRRKNFFSIDSNGYVGIYNTTAHRRVFFDRLSASPPNAIAIAPRGDTLVTESGNGHIEVWRVINEHPEVSFSALWKKVWYENYNEPAYVWQSSAANNDFEPKYSLMPLAFGTLKAAFYAMLLATPLAICGAVFTGYFMAPTMRRKVKPLVELMAALPTVVLGFLAGLWLAPFVENNLLGIFSLLVILPIGILVVSFVWLQLPHGLRYGVADGWEAAILIPVVIVLFYLSFALSGVVENILFAGDMRSWITQDLGIDYDQRNALVVGLAMGFAVIPTVFSIAEDAIFTVPKHLSYGSLALGATPWQTLYRVVLPTASPGIFSASMIGFGRAVGETMIVLMATGNTPIMDFNIFEGMRTLAANIAVEVPETEVDSTHYRILFLAALVLFLFTFVFNTAAEVIRQRLRDKYSTI